MPKVCGQASEMHFLGRMTCRKVTCCICAEMKYISGDRRYSYPPPFVVPAKMSKLEFSDIFGNEANSVCNKARQSNLIRILFGRLLSVCGDLGPRRILKEVVFPRHDLGLQN